MIFQQNTLIKYFFKCKSSKSKYKSIYSDKAETDKLFFSLKFIQHRKPLVSFKA